MFGQDYHWGESDLCRGRNHDARQNGWLPPGFKDWNALLTEAVREGMKNGEAPDRCAELELRQTGTLSTSNIRWLRFLPLIGKVAGTGAQPMSGDTTTVKQVSPFIGPSQRFTMDWSNMDGSTENIVLGESSDPLSPYYRDQWNDWYDGHDFALPFTPPQLRADATYAAPGAMSDEQGTRDAGSDRGLSDVCGDSPGLRSSFLRRWVPLRRS